ncbi:hypothetical protein K466DRAFT_662377 [Polyporus arcularius HHB13444]|uniref:Uncharacterized protein n=1 Tax=Polyporus arcularius HHB13444 TaxID=1314778 RepID=A0A5C3PH45_9APHY|nr:hypothetical protein K466DRAFT_662377 [Polyporus arcularius HHB13444]
MLGESTLNGRKPDADLMKEPAEENKGYAVAGLRGNPRLSDSDSVDLTRQHVSPAHKETRAQANIALAGVASRRDAASVGPGSDSDNRASAVSEDGELRRGSSTRSVRGVGTESPATTPVGSPSQTPGPATSSSDGAPQRRDGMDVDSEGDRPLRVPSAGGSSRAPNARSDDVPAPERTSQDAMLVSYIPCHTWPPCNVCARIAGGPPPKVAASSFMVVRQRQIALARELESRPAPIPVPPRPVATNATTSTNVAANAPSLRLPIISRSELAARSEFAPPPLSPPPLSYDPPPGSPPRSVMPQRNHPQMVPRHLHHTNPYMHPPPAPPPNWPMEPLFVSAGVGQLPRHTGYPPPPIPLALNGGIPHPGQPMPHIIRQVTLSSVSAPVRHHPYARNAQPSSSATRVEDMNQPLDEGHDPNAPGQRPRGRGKGRSKKIRAKRYNRKKREEWPPEGWQPIWEEERPRRWDGYELPDDVATDKVYDHLRRRFDLKSMGHCRWDGCVPTEASKDGYKMLKRHVETVHLGLKLICKLCGVRKRADNRRKATHKRGCPERQEGPAVDPSASTTPGGSSTLVKIAPRPPNADGSGAPGEEDELADDDEGLDDGGEEDDDDLEEDELEEDELEEDQLDDDQGGEGGGPQSRYPDDEYESEDD